MLWDVYPWSDIDYPVMHLVCMAWREVYASGEEMRSQGIFCTLLAISSIQFPLMLNLDEVNIHINVAEFVEALITCETFAQFFKSKMRTLEINNVSVKAWLDRARSPRHLFYRCAQSTHLHMLSKKKKIQKEWVPSNANVQADQCSRRHYPRRRTGHVISGSRFKKI